MIGDSEMPCRTRTAVARSAKTDHAKVLKRTARRDVSEPLAKHACVHQNDRRAVAAIDEPDLDVSDRHRLPLAGRRFAAHAHACLLLIRLGRRTSRCDVSPAAASTIVAMISFPARFYCSPQSPAIVSAETPRATFA